MMQRGRVPVLLVVVVAVCFGCQKSKPPVPQPGRVPPSILLVTLDTTRADAIGPEAVGIESLMVNSTTVQL